MATSASVSELRASPSLLSSLSAANRQRHRHRRRIHTAATTSQNLPSSSTAKLAPLHSAAPKSKSKSSITSLPPLRCRASNTITGVDDAAAQVQAGQRRLLKVRRFLRLEAINSLSLSRSLVFWRVPPCP